MTTTDELIPLLKKLRMSGVLESIDLRLDEAIDDRLAHREFLYRLLKDEAERRDAKQLDLRIRRANFEHPKNLEDFDFHFNPEIPKAKVLDLATCNFMKRHENVMLLGPTGVGKSHIAQALGHRACRLGHAVLFLSAQDFFKQLRTGRGDGTYDRKLGRMVDAELLIVDDLGLRALRDDEPLDLYEVIRLRYERASTVITSNRDEAELHALFQDPLLGSAAMDRLLHDAHVVRLLGDTYRNSKKPRSKKSPEA
jgi:DNA replication protein DnaC